MNKQDATTIIFQMIVEKLISEYTTQDEFYVSEVDFYVPTDIASRLNKLAKRNKLPLKINRAIRDQDGEWKIRWRIKMRFHTWANLLPKLRKLV